MALPGTLARPSLLLAQFSSTLLGALPLALVAGIAIGIVVWIHLRAALLAVAGQEALPYLPQGLSLAVSLELAPLAAGLIVAGRSGASLGAELGSMRLSEQIDALELLGRSPLRELVAPRLWACMLTLPILYILILYLALSSGYLAESFGGGMTVTRYVSECLRRLTLQDVVPALGKTVIFGFLVGTAGCYHGLHAHGGTEGVGRAATAGVVTSILLVLISNVVLVRIIQIVNLPG